MGRMTAESERLAQSKVLQEILMRNGMLVKEGPDPYHPGGSIYKFGSATEERVAKVCSEMESRCGWTWHDTISVMAAMTKERDRDRI